MSAGQGLEALRLLRSSGRPVELIILNLGMPFMDGWQFRDAALAAVPVIVLSAERYVDVDGAAAVLRKPLDLDRLAGATHGALGTD